LAFPKGNQPDPEEEKNVPDKDGTAERKDGGGQFGLGLIAHSTVGKAQWQARTKKSMSKKGF